MKIILKYISTTGKKRNALRFLAPAIDAEEERARVNCLQIDTTSERFLWALINFHESSKFIIRQVKHIHGLKSESGKSILKACA